MSDCKHKYIMLEGGRAKSGSKAVVYCDKCRKRAPAKITVDWGKAK